jgi:Fic family protein
VLVLNRLLESLEAIPAATAWYLTDLAEARGKQDLFTKQAPQRLKSLKEHAIIESAVSSNRIEGIEIDGRRIGTVVFGKRMLRDRDEEEVRGYRKALELIHAEGSKLKVTEKTIRKLHCLSRGEIWDAGKYKEKDSDIIEHLADGRKRVRFVTVKAKDTPQMMRDLVSTWSEVTRAARDLQPLVALALFNLDFLCIHPFRDGNGRVSRLLLLLQSYALGFEVGRYVSLERIIEENKGRYYETLEASSHGWHEGKADPWPFVNYVLSVLRSAYKEFESRVGNVSAERGSKANLIAAAIGKSVGYFRVSDIQRECPGVGVDYIRKTLGRLQKEKKLKCLGRGQLAEWSKTKRWR